jgi:FkbM family methyltransferase
VDQPTNRHRQFGNAGQLIRISHRGRPFTFAAFAQDDRLAQQLARHAVFYELALLRYIAFVIRRRRLAPAAMFVDVGANIGNHAVFLGHFVVQRVIAVEPNPQVLPILERNLSANGVDARVYRCALGRKPGHGRIQMPPNAEHNVAMAQVAPAGPGDAASGIPVRTLDEIVDEAGAPGGLTEGAIAGVKIDVEGMELDVLQGGRQTLRRHRPDLFVEAADAAQRRRIERFLSPFGYRRLSRWAVTPVYHFSADRTLRTRLAIHAYAAGYKSARRVQKTLQRLAGAVRRG